jgi:hypothetical protein
MSKKLELNRKLLLDHFPSIHPSFMVRWWVLVHMHTCTRLALETEEEEHNETEEEEEARTRTRTRTRTRVGSSEEACEIGRTARS